MPYLIFSMGATYVYILEAAGLDVPKLQQEAMKKNGRTQSLF